MAGIDLGDAWADNVWEENVWANGVWAGQENYPQGATDPNTFDPTRGSEQFIRTGAQYITTFLRTLVRRYS